MRQTITRDVFLREMLADPYNSYSREAIDAIFGHIEEREEDLGEDMEFDITSIRGEYTEYESLAEYNAENTPQTYESLEALTEALAEDIYIVELPGGRLLTAREG